MNAHERLVIRKERVRNMILLKEYEIKDSIKELSASLSPGSLRHEATQLMLNRPDLVIKVGYGIYKVVKLLRRK